MVLPKLRRFQIANKKLTCPESEPEPMVSQSQSLCQSEPTLPVFYWSEPESEPMVEMTWSHTAIHSDSDTGSWSSFSDSDTAA